MTTIQSVDAWEVLDSRGDPTVRARVTVDGGQGTFTVPAGASTGRHEAVERRDGGNRYGGKGVRTAVRAVRETLGPGVEGLDASDQADVDAALADLDGTTDFSNLGANAVLSVSGAVAHAATDALDRPLYAHVGAGGTGALPLPMVNILSGGLHAQGGVEIQDFLVIPTGATSYSAALETAWSVRDAVRERVMDRGERPLVADEGGFAPPLAALTDAFDLLVAGIEDAGHEPARDDVAIAVDVAASHFFDPDTETYRLESLDRELGRDSMIDLVTEWVEDYPVISLEDPLSEDDWTGWEALQDRIGDRVQLLGDDLLVTNRDRLDRAVESGAANAVLVKPNQAGTITRAVEVLEAASEAGFTTVVSARSGETCDTTIADLAVGLDAGQIKIGSLARSERLAKYNRLLAIERETDGRIADPGIG